MKFTINSKGLVLSITHNEDTIRNTHPECTRSQAYMYNYQIIDTKHTPQQYAYKFKRSAALQNTTSCILRTFFQIWSRSLIDRITSNASRPADLSRLRRDFDGIGVVTTRHACRPRAATTAMLVARNDLPRGNGGHTTSIASLWTIHAGNRQTVFKSREVWDKGGRQTRH